MNEETLKLVDLLAAKLSVTADHLWGVLVAQARIAAIIDITFSVILVIAAYYLIKWAKCLTQAPKDRYDDGIAWLPFSFISVAVVVCLAICLASIPAELLNPEYFALEQILNVGKSK